MLRDALPFAVFIAFVLAALFVDLKLFHREERAPTLKRSAVWVAVWVGLGLLFGAGVFAVRGPHKAAEYFAGYLLEYSLSVDNIFVFLIIFLYFKVRAEHQHRVLFFGILGAIVFRGVFIAAGTALIRNFEWVIRVFGAVLLLSAYRIVKGVEDIRLEDNPVLKLARRLPTTTRYHGRQFFAVEAGRRVATPLFVVLLVVETTDIVFAVDSIPAIFGVSTDPFVVLTSNVFAILGLRALYFLLAGSMDRFRLLKYGLGAVLAFIAVKMMLSLHVPIAITLPVIAVILAASVAASLILRPRARRDRASRGDEEREP